MLEHPRGRGRVDGAGEDGHFPGERQKQYRAPMEVSCDDFPEGAGVRDRPYDGET